jgi:hypothetical protein
MFSNRRQISSEVDELLGLEPWDVGQRLPHMPQPKVRALFGEVYLRQEIEDSAFSTRLAKDGTVVPNFVARKQSLDLLEDVLAFELIRDSEASRRFVARVTGTERLSIDDCSKIFEKASVMVKRLEKMRRSLEVPWP